MATDVRFKCSNCDQEFQAPERLVGGAVNCPQCSASLTVPDKPGAASVAGFLADDDVELIRDLLGEGRQRYNVGEEIGRGGMGTILLAEDRQVRRQVAMKRSAEGGDNLACFMEEAQITGQLEHPGIAPVYELGVDDQGRAFYTMKRIQGESLRTILRRKEDPWPLHRLLRIFMAICDTIAYAHTRGVIHRDLKPDNIMVGQFGEVVVIDWGVARILNVEDRSSCVGTARVTSIRQTDGTDTLVTLSGNIVGTPQYLSPEQACGNEITDGRGDVFGLGAILYEILALRPIYAGTDVSQLLTQAREGKIAGLPPDERTPASLIPVVTRALARDAADRYATASELKDEVEAYLNGFATRAEAAGFWKQASLFWARHRAACSITLIAVLSLLGGSWVSGQVNREARERAEQNLQNFQDEQLRRTEDRRQSVPALLDTARDLMRAGEWREAGMMAAIAVDYAPDDPAVVLLQSMFALHERKFTAVQAHLTRYEGPLTQPAKELSTLCGKLASRPKERWPVRDLQTVL
ncbi:MAG: serine/threonine-protein kinase [Limisphaerales bacterium]